MTSGKLAQAHLGLRSHRFPIEPWFTHYSGMTYFLAEEGYGRVPGGSVKVSIRVAVQTHCISRIEILAVERTLYVQDRRRWPGPRYKKNRLSRIVIGAPMHYYHTT